MSGPGAPSSVASAVGTRQGTAIIPSMETERAPQLVIVGRQNVGKSTLFNRLTQSRRSIVGDYPGMTRDRIRMPANWRGKPFEVTDTGGMTFFAPGGVSALVSEQVRIAINSADHVILVVDGRAELTQTDREIADLLHRSACDVSVAVNKCDTPSLDAQTASFFELGFDAIFGISAEHGRGVEILLQGVTRGFPTPDVSPEASEQHPIRVAILGRPNVGKSTLLNRITGDSHAIVSETPGTTRDAVDATAEHRGQVFVFVDTAGIRRKGKTTEMAEKLSIVMAQRHLRMADVALLLVDPSEGVTAQDAHIAGYVHEAGRACVVVVNKWDLARQTSAEFRRHIREQLKMLQYAPVVFLSARTGERIASLFPWIRKSYRAARQRIPTAKLNRFLAELDMERVTVPGRRKPRLSYVTQVRTAPPTFLFFCNRREPFHFGLERYLTNQLRASFGFEGTPIVIRSRTTR